MPPGPFASAYTQALLKARATGYLLTAEALQQVQLALLRAATEISAQLLADVAPGPLQAARLTSLRNQIRGVLLALEKRVAGVTGQAVGTTINEILAIHEEVAQLYVTQSLGSPQWPTLNLRQAFNDLPIRDLAVVAARGGTAQTFRTLVHRHIEDAATSLDTLLQSSLVRGVAVERLAGDVLTLMTHPLWAPAVLGPYGLAPGDVDGLRTLRSDARRIAASETLNALRESNAQAMDASPLVSAAKWQLSGRHESVRTSPDECDLLADTDFYGFGPGYYPPDRWPLAPHPYCGCYQGAVKLRPPSEWGRSKPVAPPSITSPGQVRISGRSVAREQTMRRNLADSLGMRRIPESVSTRGRWPGERRPARPRRPVTAPPGPVPAPTAPSAPEFGPFAARPAPPVPPAAPSRIVPRAPRTPTPRAPRTRPLAVVPPPLRGFNARPLVPLVPPPATALPALTPPPVPPKPDGFKKPPAPTKAKITGRKFDKNGNLLGTGVGVSSTKAKADLMNQFAAQHGTTVESLVRRLIAAPEDWTVDITQLSFWQDGQFSVSAQFFGTGGERLGGISRVLKLDEHIAEHALFTLRPEIGGRGLGKRFMREQVKLYDELGIHTVKVHANIDVGGHSWARFGFLPNQQGWNDLRWHLEQKLSGMSQFAPATLGITPQERKLLAEILADEDPRAIRVLAGSPGGKPLLLNSDWYGVMDLTDPKTRAYFNNYVGEG